jgi:hypothetical protein
VVIVCSTGRPTRPRDGATPCHHIGKHAPWHFLRDMWVTVKQSPEANLEQSPHLYKPHSNGIVLCCTSPFGNHLRSAMVTFLMPSVMYMTVAAVLLCTGAQGFDAYAGFEKFWLKHLPKKVAPSTCPRMQQFEAACNQCECLAPAAQARAGCHYPDRLCMCVLPPWGCSCSLFLRTSRPMRFEKQTHTHTHTSSQGGSTCLAIVCAQLVSALERSGLCLAGLSPAMLHAPTHPPTLPQVTVNPGRMHIDVAPGHASGQPS